MGQDVIIREARPDELAEIERLVQTAYQQFQQLMPETAWVGWMASIAEAVHSSAGELLVAVHEGRIAGVVQFYPDAAASHQGHWPPRTGSLRILAVSPQFRGRGYGTLLTQECLCRARDRGISTIFLYTGKFMLAARHIYEKLGFQRAPEFDGDPGPMAYRFDL